MKVVYVMGLLSSMNRKNFCDECDAWWFRRKVVQEIAEAINPVIAAGLHFMKKLKIFI